MINSQYSAGSPTAALAAFALNFESRVIPPAAVETIKTCLLDFVGNTAFGARGVPENAVLVSALDSIDPHPGVHVVVGACETRSALQAALLNGAHAHTLDFDDTNQAGVIHPGAPVIPAALVAARERPTSGEDFLAALVIGYEVACRVGRALGTRTYDRGFHPTAIAGVFGAAAAAARLKRLTPAMLVHAFGFCGSRAAGSMQFLENGAWNKRLHPGFASHDALICVALADAGALGAAAALEGTRGLLASYSPNGDAGKLVQDLGCEWLAALTAIKPYPCCRFIHAAIDAVLELRELATHTSEPTLRVRLHPAAINVVGVRTDSKLRPQVIVDAQFSVFFQVALAWHHGAPTWQEYKHLNDQLIEALAQKVVVEAADDLAVSAAEVIVEGTTLRARVDYPLGEPQRPLAWNDVARKFRPLASVAYSSGRIDAIQQKICGLSEDGSMEPLSSLLRGEQSD